MGGVQSAIDEGFHGINVRVIYVVQVRISTVIQVINWLPQLHPLP